MSATVTTAPGARPRLRPRRRTRPRTLIAAVAVAAASALLVGAGGATLALWSADTVFSGGPLSTGDLHITRGEGLWRQVTPGVAAPASGTLGAGAAALPRRRGDVAEITLPNQTTVMGENLRARLRGEAGGGLSAQLEAGTATATYRVEKATAGGVVQVSAETPLGTAADVDGLEGSGGGEIADWNVVVTVEIGGEYIWQGVPQAGPAAWTLDDVVIGLQQVRPAPAADNAGAGS